MAQDKGGETESKEEKGTGQSESSSQQEAGLGDSYQTGAAQEQTQQVVFSPTICRCVVLELTVHLIYLIVITITLELNGH